MDNERPNDRTTWSRRLEEPGALPGTGLTDKEAAWDKLYDRLKESEGTPRRRRMIWLWAAAACLLLIIIPAALLLRDRHRTPHPDPEKIPVAANQPIHPAPGRPADPATASHPPVAVTPAPTAGSPTHPSSDPAPGHPVASHLSSAHPTASHPGRPTPSRPDLNKLLAHNADTLTLVFAPRPDLSKPLTVAAAASHKKEQRVVHINELGAPQPTPATVKGPRQKPGGLRIGLSPQETFRPSTTYAEPEAHSIISLKHAQNP